MLLRLIRAGLAGLMLLSLLAACGGGRDPLELKLTLQIDGTAAPESPVGTGTTALTLKSGQSLAIASNIDIAVVDSLSAATASSVTRTTTTWSATLSSSVATTVTLLISSRDDPSLVSTITVAITPQDLAVDVLVEGAYVTATPVGDGETYVANIRSGQTIAVKSNLKTDFTLSLGDARTSERIESTTGWQARLSSQVATEVSITATPQGDSSRSATIKFVITPTPLEVNLQLDGTAVNTVPVLAGETYTVTIQSGQTLAIASSVAMVVDETLGSASKSNYSKTATLWTADLGSAAAAEVLLAVKSNADNSLVATIKVLIDPPPLEVEVKVAGVDVTATPIANGETRSFTVQSGQTVVVSSANLRIDVTETLNSAQLSGRTSSNNAWGAAVSSATSTEVLLKVVPQGDTSRWATVKLVVTPTPMALTLTANGTQVNSSALLAGQTLAVALTSGNALVIDSVVGSGGLGAVNITVTETLNGATRSNYSKTATRYSANFTSAAGTEVTLSVAPASGGSEPALIKVTVAPQVYTSTILRSAGEFSRFETTSVAVDGTSQTQTYTSTVKSVVADGSSYTAETSNGSSAVTSLTADINGNLLSQTRLSDSRSCTYSPTRELLSFPLFVGKTATAQWTSSCSDGVSESASATSNVQGVETVTIGATSVQALRVRIDVTVTGSNDPKLEGGSSGTASYSQVWFCKWAIGLQRPMFCSRETTYVGTAPDGYPKTYSETMSQYSKP
ncbi:hypothetical protein [Ideonella sp.]|uniref:hypothetical protein n=1 Tax=Ideonella sp. TaxID=1929293 RepID=UPI003BB62A83